MTRKMTEWPSERGPVTKIMPSDGCKGDAVPVTAVRWYNFPEFGGYLGIVGLEGRPRSTSVLTKCRAMWVMNRERE